MIDKINEMKTKLEQLLLNHDLGHPTVIETSQELDALILEYYADESVMIEFDPERKVI